MANQIIWQNKPNMDKIMQTLCDVATRDSHGEYEYTYTLKKPKEEEQKNA